ncbi:MAG: amino acid adenylation domain-containing protein [Firmicutes bacterium]|nr:amino acid adenylation domain-containing protein [Bacillota bacterium]
MTTNQYLQNIIDTSALFQNEKNFWCNRLGDDSTLGALPPDYGRSYQAESANEILQDFLPEATGQKLLYIGNNSRQGVFIILLAGLVRLFSAYQNSWDLTIGIPLFKVTSQRKSINNGLLPIRIRLNPGQSFKDLILAVKQAVIEADAHKNYPFDKLAELLNLEVGGGGRYLSGAVAMMAGLHSRNFLAEVEADLIFSFECEQAKIKINIEYSRGLYRPETINRLAGHFRNILAGALKNPEIKLPDIDMLSEAEKHQLIYEFNNTRAEYPDRMTVHQLFEEQAERVPDHVALIFRDRQLTYRELNERANLLAHELRDKGAAPNECVGLIAERSAEMVIGILGILKAGSAYLPVDPRYPEARMNYLLEDSGIDIVLVESGFDVTRISKNRTVIVLNDEAPVHGHPSNPTLVNGPTDLAYIMYTSGSTGHPKGVMVEHRSVVRLVKNTNYIHFDADDRILLTGAVMFDATTFEIWGALLNGLQLCLISEAEILDPGKLGAAILKYNITTLWLTSPLFNHLAQQRPELFKSLKNLLVGGDVLSPQHINRVRGLCERLRIVNGYGPTENTTFSTCFAIEKDYDSNIPIGKPISNSMAYILNRDNQIQPIGVPGELWVAGDGVARGYLNQPELTAEKFIAIDTFPAALAPPPEGVYETSLRETPPPKPRLYRTGDLARWLPDGNIEFIGRIDRQVKIRGRRIELGEIESLLLKHEAVKEAVVIAGEDNNSAEDGSKYLCAYYVGRTEITPVELRNYLAGKLPDYMIPAYLIPLPGIPLNKNGKVDRKALPKPEAMVWSGKDYAAPRNEMEAKLAAVWQEVLGIPKIGIHDNFYALGGDSLKAIKVLATSRKYGFTFDLKHLFQFPAISLLAKYVKELDGEKAPELVQGETGLLQTQWRFFSRNYTDMHHWNGGFMLYRQAGFDETIVKKVFDQIVIIHDALRIVFKFEGEKIIQYIRGMEPGLYGFRLVDLRGAGDYEAKIKEENRKIQASLDLTAGPLMKVVLYKTSEGDHLLLVIHHLVLDGVSIREIIEDFRAGYQQASSGAEIRLQPKTDSLRAWSQRIYAYAQSEELLAEAGYWQKLEETVLPPLPRDMVAKSNKIIDGRSITQSLLTFDETQKLLEMAKKSDGFDVKTASLTAFGLAIANWTGQNKVMIYLASHGREPIFEDLDVSRTVGWFSNYFPVLLDLGGDGDIYAQARRVQQMLNEVPNNGFGYEILRYLTFPASGRFKLWPEISFNYSGNFSANEEGETAAEDVFVESRIFPGLTISPNSERDFTFTVDSGILGGVLYLRFHFNRLEYKADTIMSIIRNYRENLTALVNRCCS